MTQIMHSIISCVLICITWEMFLKQDLLSKPELEIDKKMMGENILSIHFIKALSVKILIIIFGAYLFNGCSF
ncbi:MAG TPA: hypothetical protein VLG50_06105 [Candidatus Saccharimonadales bacterium]|nr:hypothetical protein [Candidatus Saccharimonadales bacterium]